MPTKFTVLGPIDGMTVEGACPYCGKEFKTGDTTYLRNETTGAVKPYHVTCPHCRGKLEAGASYLKSVVPAGATVVGGGEAPTMRVTITPTEGGR